MWEVMRHACESRMSGVELLGKVEEWLTIWTSDVREYRTLIFYPFNLRGLRAIAADAAQALTQKLGSVALTTFDRDEREIFRALLTQCHRAFHTVEKGDVEQLAHRTVEPHPLDDRA